MAIQAKGPPEHHQRPLQSSQALPFRVDSLWEAQATETGLQASPRVNSLFGKRPIQTRDQFRAGAPGKQVVVMAYHNTAGQDQGKLLLGSIRRTGDGD